MEFKIARKLTTIMFTDIVGFTDLMSNDVGYNRSILKPMSLITNV